MNFIGLSSILLRRNASSDYSIFLFRMIRIVLCVLLHQSLVFRLVFWHALSGVELDILFILHSSFLDMYRLKMSAMAVSLCFAPSTVHICCKSADVSFYYLHFLVHSDFSRRCLP